MMNRVLMVTLYFMAAICMTIPAWAETQTLTPDSDPWIVDINADSAYVSIAGAGSSTYSSVQVTVEYIRQEDGLAQQSSFPVNVMLLRTVEVTYSQQGFQVKRITFKCTRGEVQIEVAPGGGSFS